jgi:hypothetical protein
MLKKLSKVPKMEPANRLLNAPKALKKSSKFELIATAAKDLDRELADHE